MFWMKENSFMDIVLQVDVVIEIVDKMLRQC